jgi:FkbM family methyltransferase
MYASPEDLAVGRVIFANGIYEPSVTRAFRTRLRPGMTVVDVGANIGCFSLLSASPVGSTGSVIAVEPNPRNVKALHASAARNGFQHVHVFQTAASDECGLLFLNVDSSNETVSPAKGDIDDMLSRETVPALTLDTIIKSSRRADLIKLDTEGAEYKVLRGGRKFLSASRPTIISEFSPGALQVISAVAPEKYLELFVDLGCQISVLGEAAELPWGSDHIDIVAEPLERASQQQ